MEKDIDGTVVVGLEEARLWLPAHVLDEPSDSEVYLQSQQRRRPPLDKVPQEEIKPVFEYVVSSLVNRHATNEQPTWPKDELRFSVPQGVVSLCSKSYYDHSFAKPGRRLRQKPRFPINRTRGGPGMQAVFLGSGQRSCGTGFFLPRQAGEEYQPTRKTGCSPVLLPCRVVQALNLDVHSLASPLSPQREVADQKNRKRIVQLADNENLDKVTPENRSRKTDMFSKSHSVSPEIFLPKEWSY